MSGESSQDVNLSAFFFPPPSQSPLARADDASFRRLLEDLAHYFETHNVPKKLRSRARDYIVFRRHASNFPFQELPVLEMSPALRGELLMHVNRQMLNREGQNLFADGPTAFVVDVANKLRQCCFGPEDLVIAEEGDVADCLFLGANDNAPAPPPTPLASSAGACCRPLAAIRSEQSVCTRIPATLTRSCNCRAPPLTFIQSQLLEQWTSRLGPTRWPRLRRGTWSVKLGCSCGGACPVRVVSGGI